MCGMGDVKDKPENGSLRPSGSESSLQSPQAEFPQIGIRLHVLPPGQPNGLYHFENQQETSRAVWGVHPACRGAVAPAVGLLPLLGTIISLSCWRRAAHPMAKRGERSQVLYPVVGRSRRRRMRKEREETSESTRAACRAGEPRGRRGAAPSYWGRLPWASYLPTDAVNVADRRLVSDRAVRSPVW